jgi:hypothetical protein
MCFIAIIMNVLHTVGCGPHLYNLTRPGFDTIYQILGKPVYIKANITETPDRLRWAIETLGTPLSQHDIDVFRSSRVFETHLQYMDIMFNNKTLDGIQIYAHDNESQLTAGRPVSILAGEPPVVTVVTREYKGSLSVCMNVTGTPLPRETMRDNMQRVKSDSGLLLFCTIENLTTVDTGHKIAIEFNNCFGQVTAYVDFGKSSDVAMNSSYSFADRCLIASERKTNTFCFMEGINVTLQSFPKFQNCPSRTTASAATNPPEQILQPFESRTNSSTSTALLATESSVPTFRSIAIGNSSKAIYRDSATATQKLRGHDKFMSQGTRVPPTQPRTSDTSSTVTVNRKNTDFINISGSPRVATNDISPSTLGPSPTKQQMLKVLNDSSESPTQFNWHTSGATVPTLEIKSKSSSNGWLALILAIAATIIIILILLILLVRHRRRRATVTLSKHQTIEQLYENSRPNILEAQFAVEASLDPAVELTSFRKHRCSDSDVYRSCSGYNALEPHGNLYPHPVSSTESPGHHSDDGYDYLTLPVEENSSCRQPNADVSAVYAEPHLIKGNCALNDKQTVSDTCTVPIYATIDKSKKSMKRARDRSMPGSRPREEAEAVKIE